MLLINTVLIALCFNPSAQDLPTTSMLWLCSVDYQSRPELGGWAFTPFPVFFKDPSFNYCPIVGTRTIPGHLCYCFTGRKAQGKSGPGSYFLRKASELQGGIDNLVIEFLKFKNPFIPCTWWPVSLILLRVVGLWIAHCDSWSGAPTSPYLFQDCCKRMK